MIKSNKDAFLKKVSDVATALGIPPSWLMDVMYLESGFNEKAVNGIGATGLIQFTKTTATNLGYTTGDLLLMTNVQQMDVVKSYFERAFKSYGKAYSFDDLYCLVFYPPWKASGDGAALPSSMYAGNSSFDINGDGKVTKGEFFDVIYKRLGRKKKVLNCL